MDMRGYRVWVGGHIQQDKDRSVAAQLYAGNWYGLELDGRRTTGRQLLSQFPAGMVRSNPELAVLAAAAERFEGSLDEAERYLQLAEAGAALVPGDRRQHFQVGLAFTRLSVARIRVDLDAVAEAV